MDAVLTPRATEQKQSFAQNKQTRMKNPKQNGRGNFVSDNPCENFDTYAGLLNPPPPSRAMSFSYSHPLSAYVQQQPPLLPLPHVSQNRSSKGHVNCKNRTRDMSLLTPKKSKPTKREEAKKRSGTQSILVVASDNRWGPDPKDLPKVVLGMGNIDDVVSGSVFNLAPPPSSLPLPKFSLRSKLGCNAGAAGGAIDDGATNNLRRLLRLR
ncbi:hypothetical protein E2542_SST04027 [Spatholobus suberectus]|nr:hypothetical protein E2542_SST04027 [Spatholobus suberectus]